MNFHASELRVHHMSFSGKVLACLYILTIIYLCALKAFRLEAEGGEGELYV